MNTVTIDTAPGNTDLEPSWRGLSVPPRAPLRGAIAASGHPARRRRAAAARPVPGRRLDRSWWRGRPGHGRPPAGSVLRRELPSTPRSASARPTWPATGTPAPVRISLTFSLPWRATSRRWSPSRCSDSDDSSNGANPRSKQGTPSQARQNIHRHYDLSNDLFVAFLDETLSYSSAMFEAGDDLAAAQRRKVEAVLDLAAVGHGCEMLEIGTGWGQPPSRPHAAGAVTTSRCRPSSATSRSVASRRRACPITSTSSSPTTAK